MRIALGIVLAFALLASVLAWEEGVTYNVTLPCSSLDEIEPQWLNSSTQASKYSGTTFIVYALMPNGKPYTQAYTGIGFADLGELSLVPTINNKSTKCAVHVKSINDARNQGLLLRHMDLSVSTCNVVAGRRILAPGVAETYVDISITRPDWPSFKAINTLSLANVSHNVPIPASNTTFGVAYAKEWSRHFPKWSLEIQNWNWSAANKQSGLLIFFTVAGMFCAPRGRHWKLRGRL